MLVADAGIRGAVVCTSELDEVRVNEDNTVSAEAGALLSRIARRAQRSGLTGAEFAGGIPGSLGGAVYMNAGAYDGTMAGIVQETEFVDGEGNICTLKGDEHGFDYRTSVFREASGLDGAPFDHAAAERRFGGDSGQDERLSRSARRDKQPLNFPSAGIDLQASRRDTSRASSSSRPVSRARASARRRFRKSTRAFSSTAAVRHAMTCCV